ncbi:MAG: transglycosylase family protein [Patescibacteria group bacterium]
MKLRTSIFALGLFGLLVLLPTSAKAAEPNPSYSVVAGDSLSQVATKHSLANWKLIWDANPGLSNPDQLNVGQVLVIPNKVAVAPRELPGGYGVVASAPVSYQSTYTKKTSSARRTTANVATQQPAGDDAWAKLRACESGGNYNINTGNGYYGAYQYNNGTWNNYGGYARADLAPAAVQDAKAKETQAARGWSPWPGCSSKLGLR